MRRKKENAQMMESKIIEAKEASFPDIVLPDLNAKMRYLSDLSGKPFVLIFGLKPIPNSDYSIKS